jgi:hypothetical protein
MGRARVDQVGVLCKRNERVAGFDLALPKAGPSFDAYAVTFEGWFLLHDRPVHQIGLNVVGGPFVPVRLNVRRPDLPPLFPDLSWAAEGGFRTTLSLAQAPQAFEVHLVANVPDFMVLAVVRGLRRKLPAPEGLRFNPIALTTLARTGGTWVTHVLGQHPSILALRPFEYEPRIAGYWMDVFGVLADPQSYLQSLSSDASDRTWWLGEASATPEPQPGLEPAFAVWLGGDQVEELLMLCHERIQRSYDRIADIQGRADAQYFVERCTPVSTVHSALFELYPEGREIVLVRDFRDMVASMLAYNRKRGIELFGRAELESDEAYIAEIGRHAEQLYRAWKSRPRASYLLKYEDIIERPDETLHSLLEYIGVDSEPEVIAKMLERASSVSTRPQEHHRTTGDARSSIGRWQRDLDPPLQVACEDAFGEALAGFGY